MSVCRYYLQGNCHFGDRCRNRHVDDESDYSNRRNDYGYQERYHHQQYGNDASYGSQRYAPIDRYGQQQRYNQPDRYDPNQQYYSDRNQQQYHTNTNNYGYYDNKSQGYSEYERHPSALNQHQRNRNEWVSDDYENNFEYRGPKGSSTTYNTSTPKSKVPFSFKDPGPLPKKDQPSDLHMNQPNVFYADIIRKDVAEWELGNMWLFTCYSPVTDKPSFPGFFDLSPEELRLEAYKAKENNTYNAYIQSIEKAVLEVKRKRDELKQPSIQLMSTIEKYRNGETFGTEYNVDVGNLFSNLSSKGAFEEMIADESQPPPPQQSIASSFSFKTTLETDNAVKMSASSFSFKLPPEPQSKQITAIGISNIYTPLEELALQDKEQFLASTFCLGKIPTVPPPKDMCF